MYFGGGSDFQPILSVGRQTEIESRRPHLLVVQCPGSVSERQVDPEELARRDSSQRFGAILAASP